MTTIVGIIVIPLLIFLLSAAAGGITALIKFTSYMQKSQAAQESTAATNKEISEKLDKYIDKTDRTIIDFSTRIAVLESVSRNGNSRGY